MKNKLEERLYNTQLYVGWLTVAIFAIACWFFMFPPQTRVLLDDTTIRGQEIATRCDLKSYMGASGNEELLYQKLNALANYFKLEFVEKDKEGIKINTGDTVYYKAYEMVKQRRK